MSQTALKKKENINMLEYVHCHLLVEFLYLFRKEYGFEKFFKKSFLQSARSKVSSAFINIIHFHFCRKRIYQK